jgi:hypothetical protein
MREWGSEAITFLVRSALLHQGQGQGQGQIQGQNGEHGGGGASTTALLLSPLCELSSIPHNDVRTKQLMALSQILHVRGDTLTTSWPLAINILGDIYDNHR